MSKRASPSNAASSASSPAAARTSASASGESHAVSVDERAPRRVERPVQAEQVVLTARRADALGAADVDDPVAGNPVGGQLGRLEALAGERLHRVAPELLDEEAHRAAPSRTDAAARAASIGSREERTAASTMAPSRSTPIIRPSRSGWA